jgi:hypothetical protein
MTRRPWCSHRGDGPVHHADWTVTAGTPGNGPSWDGAACTGHLAQVRATAARTARPVTTHPATPGATQPPDQHPPGTQQPTLF